MQDVTLIKLCIYVRGYLQLDGAFHLIRFGAQPLPQMPPDGLISTQATALHPQDERHLLRNGYRGRTDIILKLGERNRSFLLRSKCVFGRCPKQGPSCHVMDALFGSG